VRRTDRLRAHWKLTAARDVLRKERTEVCLWYRKRFC